MNIDELTLGEVKQLKNMVLGNGLDSDTGNTGNTGNIGNLIGKKVIIRTYSAGVHYGTLSEKSGEEVILKDSRRLHYWETANNGISLSEVANAGLKDSSKVCETLDNLLWLKAIEIIVCTDKAIESIEGKDDYKA